MPGEKATGQGSLSKGVSQVGINGGTKPVHQKDIGKRPSSYPGNGKAQKGE